MCERCVCERVSGEAHKAIEDCDETSGGHDGKTMIVAAEDIFPTVPARPSDLPDDVNILLTGMVVVVVPLPMYVENGLPSIFF